MRRGAHAHDPISRIKSAKQIYTWINRTKIIVPITLIQPVSCASMASPPESIHHPVPASATHRHKSTPLPRSSQCRVSPWNNSIAPIQPVSHVPMNQSHCPDPASDVRPHGMPPQIDSIAPIQSGAPMTRPRKSTPSPWYSQCCTPPWHTSVGLVCGATDHRSPRVATDRLPHQT